MSQEDATKTSDSRPDAQPNVSQCTSSRERALDSVDGEATLTEIRAWYVYDWANSPFYQLFDVTWKVVLKRMATLAESRGAFLSWMSGGSYPAFILWATAFVQMLCLLTFSAFADYGNRKKVLMRRLTWAGSALLMLGALCVDSSLWPLAGVLRIAVGCCFILSVTYYNAFLPMLAASHYKVMRLSGEEHADKEVQVTDEMSNKGQLIGFLGGVVLTAVAFGLQLAFQCTDDPPGTCSEFEQLFFLSVCSAMVGAWWFGFSLYTFVFLKPRCGPPLPEGTSVFKLGWTSAWAGVLTLVKYRNCGFVMLAFFIYSDALNTVLNLATLILDDTSSSDSAILFNVLLAALGGVVGIFLATLLQRLVGTSTKALLLCVNGAYVVVSLACALGALRMGNIGFYACMAPVMLMMGVIQSMSRSLFSQMIPVGKEAQMFALYMILDKGSSLIGTFVTAVVHTATGRYEPAFWYCACAFLVGGLLLSRIDAEQGQVDAGRRLPPPPPDAAPSPPDAGEAQPC